MEPEETATIVRLVKSVFPQQPIDATTYETWHLVIGHLDFAGAQNAVIAIAHSEKFCSAAEIIREAGRAGKAHPSNRTVAQALEAANLWGLGAAEPTPPTTAYADARQRLDERLDARMAGLPAVFDVRLSVGCPWCRAMPGHKCVNVGTDLPTKPHEARARAASPPVAA